MALADFRILEDSLPPHEADEAIAGLSLALDAIGLTCDRAVAAETMTPVERDEHLAFVAEHGSRWS